MTNDAIFLIFFASVIVAIVLGIAIRRILTRKKLDALYAEPLPDHWLPLLEQHVALYRLLPESLRTLLHGHITYFLSTKTIAGCNGMVVDDTVRLTIAANACLLVLSEREPIYPTFETILVYPDTYVATRVSHQNSINTEHQHAMAGESWYRGPVVLSWDSVIRGSQDPNDGHNVVMHEFAHKLDEQSGAVNGMPRLRSHAEYTHWVQVLNDEYSDFLKRVKLNRNHIIDEYGSVSPPEFFAVATESFFEKPQRMKRELPELYEQLQNVYQIDPANWFDGNRERR